MSFGRDIHRMLSAGVADSLEGLDVQEIGAVSPRVMVDVVEGGWNKIWAEADLAGEVSQDGWRLRLKTSFRPTFYWAPHLTPEPGDVIDRRVFRSPVMIASNDRMVVWVVPDLGDGFEMGPPLWMDQDADRRELVIGRSSTEAYGHVLFRRCEKTVYKGKVGIGCFVLCSSAAEDIKNPFRRPCEFLWRRYATPRIKSGEPLSGSLVPYVRHVYSWAFDRWQDSVWQEFSIGVKTVGAPAFIVNVSQSPGYPGQWYQREFLSVWNQAWFSSLRSASGLILLRHIRASLARSLAFLRCVSSVDVLGAIAVPVGD